MNGRLDKGLNIGGQGRAKIRRGGAGLGDVDGGDGIGAGLSHQLLADEPAGHEASHQAEGKEHNDDLQDPSQADGGCGNGG
jgi:hypothetical protein